MVERGANAYTLPKGRSPHGERGLKLHVLEDAQIGLVALLMESVD